MLLSSQWFSALHRTRGVVLQTAILVVRPCAYAVMTVDALRSTISTLSVMSGHSDCSHHILPSSFPFSVCSLPCPSLTPHSGSTALSSC